MNATTVGRTLRAAGVAAALLVPVHAQVETWDWQLTGAAAIGPGVLELGPAQVSLAEVVAPDQGVLSFDVHYDFVSSALGSYSFIEGPEYLLNVTPGGGDCSTLPCSGDIPRQSVILDEGDVFTALLDQEVAMGFPDSSVVLQNFAFTPDVGIVDLGGALGGGLLGIVDPVSPEYLGDFVQALEDVDHDGHADILVASYDGGVRVDMISGQSLQSVWTLEPQASVAAANWMDRMGDVDGDGSGDVLLAFIDVDPTPQTHGAVQLRSGVDGALLLDVVAAGPPKGFGEGAAGLGDVNGDGVPDFAVGLPYTDVPALDAGSVEVRSGVDGSVLFRHQGTVEGGLLGRRQAGAGDVNADGVPDLLLGQPDVDQVLVISGAGDQVLHEWLGQPGQNFGSYIAAAGDADADGYADLALAALKGSGPGGYREVRSGADGSLLYTNLEYGGAPMAGVGDLDGDGFADLLVTAHDSYFPKVRVLGGPDGHPLLEVQDKQLGLGMALSGGFDVDGDSIADLLVGTQQQSVVVLSGDLPAHVPPHLSGVGTLQPGMPVDLAVTDCLPQGAAFLVIGLSEASLPLKGGVLVPFPDALLALVLDGSGSAALSGVWPTGLPTGFESWQQLWALDPKGPHGWTASNALQLITP